MANYNKVILVGNLTRDPQMSYLPSQTPVVELGLAVNRKWKGQNGEQREDTCFIDCTAFGKQAEVINQYMHKGNPILIEGRLQLDTWEAKDGTKRSKHKVVVENFQFLGSGGGRGGGYQGSAGDRPTAKSEAPAPRGAPGQPVETPPDAYENDGADDIPF